MDPGSFTGHHAGTGSARGLFLLKNMEEMGYVAVNVGADEVSLGPDLLRSFAAEKTFPLLSANLEDSETGKLLFPDARIVTAAGVRVGVTGITRPPPSLEESVEASGLVFRDPVESLERVLDRLDREADVVVLLANVPEAEARSLAERFPGRIEVVALGQDARSPGDIRGPEHGGAVFLAPMNKGQELGVARIALEEGRVTAMSANEIRLGLNLDPDKDMDVLVDAFERNLNDLAREAADGSLAAAGPGDGQYFVGVEECGSCHRQEYRIWSETPHAHAFESLTEAGRESLPECYQCHVTGHGDPTGYFPQRKSPELANVQCEVCHDRGSLHARDGSYGRGLLMKACARCHDSTNSPLFDPEVYWLMIEH